MICSIVSQSGVHGRCWSARCALFS